MWQNLWSFAFSVLLATFVAAGIFHQFFKQWKISRQHKYIKFCKHVIRYHNPRTGRGFRGQARLGTRARPNSGLSIKFGIKNAFTTDDEKIANAFVTDARNKLRQAIGIVKMEHKIDGEADWRALIGTIQNVVHAELSRGNEIINLADLVQFITLKISLKYLFDPESAVLADRERIRYIAKTINVLWLRFKLHKNHPQVESDWIHETRLRQYLSAFASIDADNAHNPMNLILPAYETMWRATFRAVLEIYFRHTPNAANYQAILNSFMKNPVREEFSNKNDLSSLQLSALDIVKEVLRLYPPTRRVYRQFPDDPSHVIHSANIERCHRSPLLAKSDPERFRPERWIQIRADFEATRSDDRFRGPNTTQSLAEFEEDLGFMPFAHWCPAGKRETQGFGYKMVGLLTIALCKGFDDLRTQGEKQGQEQKWELQSEAPGDELPALGTALKSGRENYLSLVYRRIA